jgi:hypothetical protein
MRENKMVAQLRNTPPFVKLEYFRFQERQPLVLVRSFPQPHALLI